MPSCRRSGRPSSVTVRRAAVVLCVGDRDRDAGRLASGRPVERDPDQLVEGHLGALGERLRRGDVHVHPHLAIEAHPLGELADRRLEPLVAKRNRLDVEREVAKGLNRRAVLLERARQHAPCVVVAPLRDRVVDRVEHQGDAGQGLDRAVVQLEG